MKPVATLLWRKGFVALAAVLTLAATLAASTSPAHARTAPHPDVATSSEAALNALSCHRLSNCWAVGYQGSSPSYGGTLIERWNNTHHAWRRVASPNPTRAAESNLNGVSCVSSSDCMAVGASGLAPPVLTVSGLAERWNGRHWAITSVPHPPRHPQTNLGAVSCRTRTFCMAVGDYVTDTHGAITHALAEKWDGSSWTVVSLPGNFASSDLEGISCASPTACLAVGSFSRGAFGYPLTEQWNGSVWSLVTPRYGIDSEALDLDGVSCANASDCLAVGRYDENNERSLERTLAEPWTPTSVALTTPKNASSVDADELWSDSCPSRTNCFAAGQAETNRSGSHWRTLVEKWNGSTWKIVHTPALGTAKLFRFLAIACVSQTDCFAVGDNMKRSHITTVAERWTGQHWHTVPSQNS
jgi:hypothetical protein